MAFRRSEVLGTVLLLVVTQPLVASPQSGASTVEAQVIVNYVHGKSSQSGNEDVVVWLTPLDRDVHFAPTHARHYQMVQKDKQFHPHVLAIPVGVAVGISVA